MQEIRTLIVTRDHRTKKELGEIKNDLAETPRATYDDLIALFATFFETDDEDAWVASILKQCGEEGRRILEHWNEIGLVAFGASDEHALSLSFQPDHKGRLRPKLDPVFDIEPFQIILLK